MVCTVRPAAEKGNEGGGRRRRGRRGRRGRRRRGRKGERKRDREGINCGQPITEFVQVWHFFATFYH